MIRDRRQMERWGEKTDAGRRTMGVRVRPLHQKASTHKQIKKKKIAYFESRVTSHEEDVSGCHEWINYLM